MTMSIEAGELLPPLLVLDDAYIFNPHFYNLRRNNYSHFHTLAGFQFQPVWEPGIETLKKSFNNFSSF